MSLKQRSRRRSTVKLSGFPDSSTVDDLRELFETTRLNLKPRIVCASIVWEQRERNRYALITFDTDHTAKTAIGRFNRSVIAGQPIYMEHTLEDITFPAAVRPTTSQLLSRLEPLPEIRYTYLKRARIELSVLLTSLSCCISRTKHVEKISASESIFTVMKYLWQHKLGSDTHEHSWRLEYDKEADRAIVIGPDREREAVRKCADQLREVGEECVTIGQQNWKFLMDTSEHGVSRYDERCRLWYM